MRTTKRFILILIILVSCIGCDQATKSIAKSVLPGSEAKSYLGNLITLQVFYNQGAFMSLGASLPEKWRLAIFIKGVGCLLAGVLGFAFLSKPDWPLKVFAVSLIVSGGAGNLLDRVFHGGSVVDFINIGIGPLRSRIFNMADLFIICGFFVLLSAAYRGKKILCPTLTCE